MTWDHDTLFKKSIESLKNKLWSNFDYLTRSWSRKNRSSNFKFFTKSPKIIIFEPFLNIQNSKTQFDLFFILHNNEYSVYINNQNVSFIGPRALNRFLKKVKKVKPGLDPKSLRIKPWSYWQDFTVCWRHLDFFRAKTLN